MTEWDENSFPPGRFQIEIKGMPLQILDGSHIHPTTYGCFFEIPGERSAIATENTIYDRVCFWPWIKIDRIYQVG